MSTHLRILAMVISLATVACAGHHSPVAADSHPAPIPTGGLTTSGDSTMAALALFDLAVDPVALTATLKPEPLRQGAAQGDSELFSLQNLILPADFEVGALEILADTIKVDCTVHHPFIPAQDPTGEPGPNNRADLGFTGFVLLLADVPTATGHTFFDQTASGGGKVVANTDLMVNADAYYQPAGLLPNLGLAANTFPYKLIARSIGEYPEGNYGSRGWAAGVPLTPAESNWTGFGVLQQGQGSDVNVVFDRAAFGSAGNHLRVALIAKYTDPKGGATLAEKRANRLPLLRDAYWRFSYRMPHGALDVQRITFDGTGYGFVPNAVSSSELVFHVEDWDARATETTSQYLVDDPDPRHVVVGEPGLPQLAVCIPGVLGSTSTIIGRDAAQIVIDDDRVWGGDNGQDSGEPGDALCYRLPVTKGAVGGQADGICTGLVRVRDPEDLLGLAVVKTLDPNLQPLTGNRPHVMTFQAFKVVMHTPGTGGWATGFSSPDDLYERTVGLAVSAERTSFVASDLEEEHCVYNNWWDDQGSCWYDHRLLVRQFQHGGTPGWQRQWGTSKHNDVIRAITLDAAGRPVVAGTIDEPLDFGGGLRQVSSEGAGFALALGVDGSYRWDHILPEGCHIGGVAVTPVGDTLLAVEITNGDFGGGERTSAENEWSVYVCAISPTGTYHWDREVATGSVGVGSLAADYAGRLNLAGTYRGATLPNGLEWISGADSHGGYVVGLDSTGHYTWSHELDSAQCAELKVDHNGGVYVTGLFPTGNQDFGGGPRVNPYPLTGGFIAAYTATGVYRWDRPLLAEDEHDDGWPGAMGVELAGLEVTPQSVVLSASFRGKVDFGTGPRESLEAGGGYYYWSQALAAYSYSGTPRWNESMDLYLHGISSDATGGLYLLGSTGGDEADVDPGPGRVSVFEDAVLFHLLPNGQW